ncbi:hypothetical protein ACWT_8044 [Actinoplanes sp. SE50]|uniref:PQQ-binding-like beta-propeller repeat protein n=1 Tax=unclassified Actinoplanes TaxID=2626549 RepID=UPI00023EE0DD|nr:MULTISPECIES: PQQ-binding-like beta-propeller repeat protein [unclassified Actinoplanes]AEV89053.1 uncharacterized protein ACPL_8175 [Actinoplanes sp. SE50/110]ATO87459.1 hypothetical protein ACWT_8044 [Actinoplanes sp. SE50]SLM04877.1 hypothetical protein ACSP50_8189 [Actinoplanes sp. SE50/110]
MAGLLVGALLVAPTWDHPGYDAEDSYFNPSAIAVRQLTPTWSASLRQVDESCSGFSAPIVGDDQVYVTDREGVSSYGLDFGDLRIRFTWDYAYDNSTPRMALAGGLLILADDDCNSASAPHGRLTALDPATGRPRWDHTVGPIVSALVDKNVILVSGSSPSDEQSVAAYRVSDGHLLWSRVDYASSGVSANGVVPLEKGDTTIAVGVSTGTVRWSRPSPARVQAASPHADRFYATDGSGALLALDAATGRTVWTAAGRASTLVAADGTRVYLASGSTVTALSAATGRVVWSRKLSAAAGQPVVAAGVVYTGSRILNAATGVPTGRTLAGLVTPAGDRLYQVDGARLTAYGPVA